MELLNQMDGFDQTVNVKVIMATNRADTLDPALLRPGRLDRKIEFPLPDRRQKRLVFQVCQPISEQHCMWTANLLIVYNCSQSAVQLAAAVYRAASQAGGRSICSSRLGDRDCVHLHVAYTNASCTK